MSAAEVGPVAAADAEACYRLAYEVFHEEMGAFGGCADHTRRELRDEVMTSAELVCARVDGEVVGSLGILYGDRGIPEELEVGFGVERYASVVPRERLAVVVRLLVSEAHRSTLVPYQLMVEAGRQMVGRGVELCFADCQVHLLNLYRSLGFRPCAPPFDQDGFGLMVPLVLLGGDLDHLEAVGSPLIDELGLVPGPPDVIDRIVALLPGGAVASTPDAGGVMREELRAAAFEVLSRPARRIGLFDGMSAEQVQRIIDAGQVVECRAGQRVVSAAQGARTVFVVLDGELVVTRDGAVVGRVGPGEPFGEIAFLLRAKRMADVVAATDQVRVVALSERVLQDLVESRSEVAAQLLRNLCCTLAHRLVEQPHPIGARSR